MAVIKPFNALRYDFQKHVNPEEVTCPPYDIIPDTSVYTRKSPFNAIFLEGGERLKTDNPYTRAKEYLETWLAEGILMFDKKPAYYLYEAEFTDVNGERETLRGFCAHVKLTPFSEKVVLPHENTLSKAKEDRRKLMTETGCHFSPVYSLYDDETGEVKKILDTVASQTPELKFTDDEGVTHSLWLVYNDEIEKLFSDKQLFIADGHHRYETSLDIYQSNPETVEPYVMMLLSSMNEDGLEVHATHRLISNIENYSEDELKKKFSENFDITDGDKIEDEKIVWVTKNGNYILTPKSRKYNLDVELLHNGILEPYFGIDAANMANQKNLTYTRDKNEVFDLVKKGELIADRKVQCGFLLSPTKISQIRDTVLRGEKMPQKSTYFYPKIITGLFMNCFKKD